MVRKIDSRIKIECATKKDIPELVKLQIEFEKDERQFAPEGDFWRMRLNKKMQKKDVEEQILDKDGCFFVAKDFGGDVVGFATGFLEISSLRAKKKDVWKLVLLYVLPVYRGKKIASKLMQAVLNNGAKRASSFMIHLSPNNKLALSIYKKKGFKEKYICLGKKLDLRKHYENKEIGVRIRKAKLEDLDTLVNSKTGSMGKNELKDYIKNKNCIFLVAERNDILLGYVYALVGNMPPIMKINKISSIVNLYVFKNVNGKKLTNKDMNKIKDVLLNSLFARVKHKAKHITVHVTPKEKDEKKYFVSRGFKDSYLCLIK